MRIGCGSALIFLGVVLVVLRGSGVITWPWFWITFPIWFTIFLFGAIVVLVFLFALIEAWIER